VAILVAGNLKPPCAVSERRKAEGGNDSDARGEARNESKRSDYSRLGSRIERRAEKWPRTAKDQGSKEESERTASSIAALSLLFLSLRLSLSP